MCLNIPSKVISIKGNKAKVQCLEHIDEVKLDLIKDVKAGDYVIIQSDYITSKIDEKEAKNILVLLRKGGIK